MPSPLYPCPDNDLWSVAPHLCLKTKAPETTRANPTGRRQRAHSVQCGKPTYSYSKGSPPSLYEALGAPRAISGSHCPLPTVLAKSPSFRHHMGTNPRVLVPYTCLSREVWAKLTSRPLYSSHHTPCLPSLGAHSIIRDCAGGVPLRRILHNITELKVVLRNHEHLPQSSGGGN